MCRLYLIGAFLTIFVVAELCTVESRAIEGDMDAVVNADLWSHVRAKRNNRKKFIPKNPITKKEKSSNSNGKYAGRNFARQRPRSSKQQEKSSGNAITWIDVNSYKALADFANTRENNKLQVLTERNGAGEIVKQEILTLPGRRGGVPYIMKMDCVNGICKNKRMFPGTK